MLYRTGQTIGYGRSRLTRKLRAKLSDLRIKTFFGTTENAVKTQIWIAISICPAPGWGMGGVYVFVAITEKELEIKLSLGEILQILSIVLFEKVSIKHVLTRNLSQNELFQLRNQLLLFDL
jgi:hypothetical protein